MTVESAPYRAMSDQVMESIRGGTIAQKVIFDIRDGQASPDALFEAIKSVGVGERQRGFARALQKTLEGKA